MKVQVNSDKNVVVDAKLKDLVVAQANTSLKRFEGKLTRVEVHLSDVNSTKAGKQDKRCMIEARPAGARPLAVTAEAATPQEALKGSLSKLQSALSTFFGRLDRDLKRKPVKKAGAERAAEALPQVSAPAKKKRPAKKAVKKAAAQKTTAKNSSLSERGPKKKTVYRARRKAWPKR